MSSLAATQADGFYFPPDWTPEMGGLSKFQGSKGANQYQQFGIIRFELPFDGWCIKCKTHISKGSRFNAKKDKDGKYHSTQIFKFTMKCSSCDNQLVIKTDPEHRTYDFAEGIRKMEQEFEPGADDSIISALTDETRQKLLTDPIFRLQYEKEDRVKAATATQKLIALHDLSSRHFKDDAQSNSELRKLHRSRRHRDAELLKEGQKRQLSIPLVEESALDVETARRVDFRRNVRRKFDASEKTKKMLIQSESIFGGKLSSERKPRAAKGVSRGAAALRQVGARVDVTSMRCPAAAPKRDAEVIVSQVSRQTSSRAVSALALLSGYGDGDD